LAWLEYVPKEKSNLYAPERADGFELGRGVHALGACPNDAL
jgi:hypothetical protein